MAPRTKIKWCDRNGLRRPTFPRNGSFRMPPSQRDSDAGCHDLSSTRDAQATRTWDGLITSRGTRRRFTERTVMPLGRGTRPHENGVESGYAGGARLAVREGRYWLWSLEAANEPGPGSYAPAPGAPGDEEPVGQTVSGAEAPTALAEPTQRDESGVHRPSGDGRGAGVGPRRKSPPSGGKGVVCARRRTNHPKIFRASQRPEKLRLTTVVSISYTNTASPETAPIRGDFGFSHPTGVQARTTR
jgi:hypothetical protein